MVEVVINVVHVCRVNHHFQKVLFLLVGVGVFSTDLSPWPFRWDCITGAVSLRSVDDRLEAASDLLEHWAALIFVRIAPCRIFIVSIIEISIEFIGQPLVVKSDILWVFLDIPSPILDVDLDPLVGWVALLLLSDGRLLESSVGVWRLRINYLLSHRPSFVFVVHHLHRDVWIVGSLGIQLLGLVVWHVGSPRIHASWWVVMSLVGCHRLIVGLNF